MIINTVGGGGDTNLNFRVVNGITQPVTAKENDIWVNTPDKITSYDFAAEMPALRSNNKNKIVYPFYNSTQSTNGIDWTDNGDGTISANGTASAASVFRLSAFDADIEYLWLEAGTYTLSGCPSGGSASTYLMELFILNPVTKENESMGMDYGNGLTFSVPYGCKARINLNVISGATVSGIVFKPQLEKGSSASAFIKGDATGQVWFNIATMCNTPINAIKKNSLMVYPISCQQYIGGAWITKKSKAYKNEAWADIRTLSIWFFNNGDLGESGGFQATAGTLNVGSTIDLTIMSGSHAYVTAKNQIDLTSFSTVTFVCKAGGITAEYGLVGVGVTRNAFVKSSSATSTSYATVTVDVTELQGLHYVGFADRSYSTANTSNFYVKSILVS